MTILLAALSFCFYHVNRIVLLGVQLLYFRFAPQAVKSWRVISGESLRRPLFLPIVMTTGPRWNPHAIIAGAGPFTVREKLRIGARTADASAKAWTVVVNAFPSFRTVGSLGSLTGGNDEIRLPPGRYTLVVRYYEWTGEPSLPAVEVDGTRLIESSPLSRDSNEFFRSLSGRTSLYYLGLHYYISVLLRHEQWFPAGFVRSQYLPVGNPESHFFYGPLNPGERLNVERVLPLLSSHRVYLTIYNRASFPIFWCAINVSVRQFDPVEGGAHYLIRAHGIVPERQSAAGQKTV